MRSRSPARGREAHEVAETRDRTPERLARERAGTAFAGAAAPTERRTGLEVHTRMEGRSKPAMEEISFDGVGTSCSRARGSGERVRARRDAERRAREVPRTLRRKTFEPVSRLGHDSGKARRASQASRTDAGMDPQDWRTANGSVQTARQGLWRVGCSRSRASPGATEKLGSR